MQSSSSNSGSGGGRGGGEQQHKKASVPSAAFKKTRKFVRRLEGVGVGVVVGGGERENNASNAHHHSAHTARRDSSTYSSPASSLSSSASAPESGSDSHVVRALQQSNSSGSSASSGSSLFIIPTNADVPVLTRRRRIVQTSRSELRRNPTSSLRKSSTYMSSGSGGSGGRFGDSQRVVSPRNDAIGALASPPHTSNNSSSSPMAASPSARRQRNKTAAGNDAQLRMSSSSKMEVLVKPATSSAFDSECVVVGDAACLGGGKHTMGPTLGKKMVRTKPARDLVELWRERGGDAVASQPNTPVVKESSLRRRSGSCHAVMNEVKAGGDSDCSGEVGENLSEGTISFPTSPLKAKSSPSTPVMGYVLSRPTGESSDEDSELAPLTETDTETDSDAEALPLAVECSDDDDDDDVDSGVMEAGGYLTRPIGQTARKAPAEERRATSSLGGRQHRGNAICTAEEGGYLVPAKVPPAPKRPQYPAANASYSRPAQSKRVNDNSDDDEDDGDDVSLERLKAVLAGVKPKHLLSMQQEMIEGRNRAIKSKTGRGKADSKNLKQYSAVKTLLEMVEDFIADRRALGEESDSEEEEDQAPATLSKSQSGDSEGETESPLQESTDWNGRFQLAIEQLEEFGGISSERMRIYSDLANLAQDFIHCAKTYGRIIITETFTPMKMKTIRPVRLGGYAGGDKYMVNNIMFKFAIDSHNLFGSDEAAVKVAGHELKGLISYFNLAIRDIHFPLMALVDYLGFRLIAMSVVPICGDSLVYGSADAGRTMHASSGLLNRKMLQAAQLLNLKPHMVGFKPETSKMMYSAGDLEGHEIDGKFYLLDFSRSFPPCSYDERLRNSYIYRLLRPEFLKAYPKPLCPDAYSGFVHIHDADAHIQEVEEATEWVLTEVIPKFASRLNMMSEEERRGFKLKEAMHEVGINLRYLGVLRQYLQVTPLKRLVLVEMIARVMKHTIRAKYRDKMKVLKLPLDHCYRELVIDYLNLVFANSPESTQYWTSSLKTDLEQYFSGALTKRQRDPNFNLKHSLIGTDFCMLFKRVVKMTNLKITPSAFKEFTTNPKAFGFLTAFDVIDIEDIGVSVRHMNIVALAQGYVLKSKARIANKGGSGEDSQRLCRLATTKFEEALCDNPGDKRALRELADTVAMLGDIEVADEYFKRAIQSDPRDLNTLFKYAVFLEEKKKSAAEAEHYYLITLENDPTNNHCLQRYGDFLESQGDFDAAEEFYILAAECRQRAKESMRAEDPLHTLQRSMTPQQFTAL